MANEHTQQQHTHTHTRTHPHTRNEHTHKHFRYCSKFRYWIKMFYQQIPLCITVSFVTSLCSIINCEMLAKLWLGTHVLHMLSVIHLSCRLGPSQGPVKAAIKLWQTVTPHSPPTHTHTPCSCLLWITVIIIVFQWKYKLITNCWDSCSCWTGFRPWSCTPRSTRATCVRYHSCSRPWCCHTWPVPHESSPRQWGRPAWPTLHPPAARPPWGCRPARRSSWQSTWCSRWDHWSPWPSPWRFRPRSDRSSWSTARRAAWPMSSAPRSVQRAGKCKKLVI